MNAKCIGWMLAAFALVAAVPAAAGGSGKCRARGQEALSNLTRGRFDQARRDFSPQTATHVSADMLEATWRQLQAQAGDFRKLGRLHPRDLDGQRLLAAPITFANSKWTALVACDAGGRITTFRLLPASRLPATATSSAGTRRVPVDAVPGVVSRVVQVPSPPGPLPGLLDMPAGDGPFPAVVMVAGSGPNDMDETVDSNKPFRDIAIGLAKAGIASLRYDKRSHVHGAKMMGNKSLTVDDEVTDDALGALRLLAGQKHIDADRVFVLGHSLGGMMAPRIGQRDSRVAGLVMLAAPARPLLEVIAQQVHDLGSRMGRSKAEMASAGKLIAAERQRLATADPDKPPEGGYAGLPQSYWSSLHDYQQVAVAEKLEIPMLILQGESDFQVSPENDFGHWRQALHGRHDVAFHAYPDLNHLFMPAGKTGTPADYKVPGHVDEQVISDIAHWIKSRPANPGT